MRPASRTTRRWLAGLVLALVGAGAWPTAATQRQAAPTTPRRLRIALVPLDDRPVCLQYPRMLAGLAHAEVVTPPNELLGRFTRPGDADAIGNWLRTQDWATFDALIVSVDMIAYGGLVASRVHAVDEATALRRLRVLRDVHAARPGLPVYGSSVIMRLAPTADGLNEGWRESLARYAELAAGPATPAESEELTRLRGAIPADARRDYETARARNRTVNLAAVALAAEGVVDHLVVSQDDARPRGLHVADRQAVVKAASARDLTGRVGVQPGADEIGMLLLARAVLDARGTRPTIRTTFSSEQARAMVAPFEDRPLHETVAFQLVTAGAGESRMDDPPDLDLFVFASRHDPGAGKAFAGRIVQALAAGSRAIVADVDPRGDVQGASADLTDALLAANAFPRMYGYASWNTAGNTVGTSIAHGLLSWSGALLSTRCSSPAWSTMAGHRAAFMLHRLVNDHAYQGVLRTPLNAGLRAAGRTPLWLREHASEIAASVRAGLEPRLAAYAEPFTRGAWVPPAPSPTDVAVQIGAPTHLVVTLPWDRTFEAAISFELPAAGLSGPARRLPMCEPAAAR